MSKLEDVLSKKAYCNSNVLLTGVWGQSPQPLEAMRAGGEAIFRSVLEKKAVLTPLDHISQVFGAPFESTRFLTVESQLKKFSCSVLLWLAI